MPKTHLLLCTSICVISSLIFSSCSFKNGIEGAAPTRISSQQVSTETKEAEAPSQTEITETPIEALEATPPGQTETIETPIETLEVTTSDQTEIVGTLVVTGDFNTIDCPSQRMAVLGHTDDSASDILYIYCFSAQPFIIVSYEIIQHEVGVVTGLSVSPGGDRIALKADTFDRSQPGRLYLVDLNTAIFELSEFTYGGAMSVTWGSDQAYIAYITQIQSGDDAIIVRHLESGIESTVLVSSELASDQLVMFYNLLWLPESNELVLGAGFGSPARLFRGYKLGIECDSTTSICNHDTMTELPWLDSERFVYTSGPNNSTLIAIDVVTTNQGSGQHIVMQDLTGVILLDTDITDYLNGLSVYNPPSFSKSTNQLLFATGELFVFDLNTGTVTPIELTVGGRTLYVTMASWLP
nr:hypothetical protein [Anaerolineae bacterium]